MIVLISALQLGGNGDNHHQYIQSDVDIVAALGAGGTVEIPVIYQGRDTNARVAVDGAGNPKTASTDSATFPCPPHCMSS